MGARFVVKENIRTREVGTASSVHLVPTATYRNQLSAPFVQLTPLPQIMAQRYALLADILLIALFIATDLPQHPHLHLQLPHPHAHRDMESLRRARA
jgi:hypothetical protein